MDQANHNLLISDVGNGASCSHLAIVLLYWYTTLSRYIVTVFNNEAREGEARAFCSWFSKYYCETLLAFYTTILGRSSVP